MAADKLCHWGIARSLSSILVSLLEFRKLAANPYIFLEMFNKICFEYTGRVSVRRERLNSGGYTRDGVYFGVGEPLYFAQDDDGHYSVYYRATDREDAVAIARQCYPKAKIRP